MENQEYFVVTASSLENLMDAVEARFKEGWRCQGGVFIYSLSADNPSKDRLYHQAMTRQR